MIVLNVFNESREIPTLLVVLLFFVPFLGGVVWYSYKTRHGKSWRKGIVPVKMKFTQDNLLEVYLALGARMILLDYKKSKGHTQFINGYFNRYFGDSNYNFGDSLLFSMRHPVKLESACTWLNNHLDDVGKKSQVIYFLVGLALTNEHLDQRQLYFISEINDLLGIERSEFERIIAIYRTYYETRSQERDKSKRRISKQPISENLYVILGINKNTTAKEIKKAYRKLVKIHHPDAFTHASEAQQIMAKEKFIQIHHAYETLMELHQ